MKFTKLFYLFMLIICINSLSCFKSRSKAKRRVKTKNREVQNANKNEKFPDLKIPKKLDDNGQKPDNIVSKDLNKQEIKKSENTNHLEKIAKFAVGFSMGFGLNSDASNDLIECFKPDSVKNITEIGSKSDNDSLLSKVIFFLSKITCPALRKSFWSFLKNKIISLGIKGLLAITVGPIGLLAKYGYDITKIILEVKEYHKQISKEKLDYTSIGNSIGRLAYYLQDIVFKKRRKQ